MAPHLPMKSDDGEERNLRKRPDLTIKDPTFGDVPMDPKDHDPSRRAVIGGLSGHTCPQPSWTLLQRHGFKVAKLAPLNGEGRN
jgi:hypothetical protein